MPNVAIPVAEQAERYQISPEHVRISMAAAMVLGLQPGRFYRDAATRCVNLLQNYPEGCWANCTYCGLARERPGAAEDNTFIRVGWPLFPTSVVARKIGERADRIGRVCIAQVHDKRANDDLVEMTRAVRASSTVPISALVSADLLNDDWLVAFKDAGADIVGIGLDAASEEVFHATRGYGAKGPHDWAHHWEIVSSARRIFGPLRVNCHVVVGLGECDNDLVELFVRLKDMEVAAYLFSFNPEPGTAMEDAPRAPLHRWRRIQLVKYLIEHDDLPAGVIGYDDDGMIDRLDVSRRRVHDAVAAGTPFMTDGCPDEHGDVACNRPFGSYRPGEAFRDYPFLPVLDDTHRILAELQLDDLVA